MAPKSCCCAYDFPMNVKEGFPEKVMVEMGFLKDELSLSGSQFNPYY